MMHIADTKERSPEEDSMNVVRTGLRTSATKHERQVNWCSEENYLLFIIINLQQIVQDWSAAEKKHL